MKPLQIGRIHIWGYYETFEDIESAIYREKRLKEWQRKWKINLILKMNPLWKDLYMEIIWFHFPGITNKLLDTAVKPRYDIVANNLQKLFPMKQCWHCWMDF